MIVLSCDEDSLVVELSPSTPEGRRLAALLDISLQSVVTIYVTFHREGLDNANWHTKFLEDARRAIAEREAQEDLPFNPF